MRRILSLLIALVALALPGRAADGVFPDAPVSARLVNDFAGAFTEIQRDSLENVLVDFDERTSNQIAVVTLTDLHGYDVAQYALTLANKWGIGSTRNNGILILLKTREGGYVDVAIQVGRGLEGAVPDAYASRIIRNIMGPHLRQDQYWEAVSKACVELMALAEGEISEPRDYSDDDDGALAAALIIAFLAFAVFMYVLYKASKDGNGKGGGGFFGGPTITFGSGSSHGSSWGSAGGFGGGSFGGGGFGGFGGGSFGGGGASGRF